MLDAWQELVLKWLNCFDIGSISSIQDVKNLNFLKVLTTSSSPTDEDPFSQLLTFLQNHYPHYVLGDRTSSCWCDDEELYLLSSLLLLHASIFEPTEVLHRNASETLNGIEQRLIVDFLEKAMIHEQKLTKQTLMESVPTCVPTIEASTSEIQHLIATSPSSPARTNVKRRSLTEFLSSPVARRKRKSGNLRERLSSLEIDLEEEQAERVTMEEKIIRQDGVIADLARKYKEKSEEVEVLKDSLRKLEEGQEVLSRDRGDQQAEKRRLQQELKNSEEYIKNLEGEMDMMKSTHHTVINKLTVAEKRSSEFEELYSVSRHECTKLKTELEHHTEENAELKFKCTQLQRDLNQIQSCTILSPRRSFLNSPNQTLSPAPENLGFIVEKEMIDKENENLELQKSIRELDDELQKLKAAFKELQDKAEKETETASRVQKKLETKLLNMQSTIDSTCEELNMCKKVKDDLKSKLSDISIEKDALGKQLSELTSMKVTLVAEQKALNDAKHSLEVKVAKLEAKLLISAEREKELHEISKKRSCEVEEARQKMDSKDIELKKSLKEQEMIEEQLKDTIRKLNLAKTIEQEKYDLEEQVLALKQVNEDFESQVKTTSEGYKNLEKQLQTLSEERKSLLSQLNDLSVKRNDLASTLDEVTAERNAVVAEKLSLLKDKVRWEEELQEAYQRLQDAKEQVLKEEIEKKTVQDKLAEALAANDRLTSNLSISAQQENDLSSNLVEMCKQKKIIENQLSAIKKERDRFQVSLQESLSQLESINQDRESLNHKLADKVVEVENMTSKLTELTNGKVKLETQVAEETAESNKLQNQLTDVKQKLKSAQSEVSQVKTELEALQKECEEKSSVIANLEAEKNDIEDDLCHYGKRLNEQIQVNLSLKTELSSLKEEKEKVSLECELLTKHKLEIEEKLAHLESNMLATTSDKESLLNQLEKVSQQRDELSAQLKNLEKSLTDLERELNTSRSTNVSQYEEMLDQSSQIVDLQHKLGTVVEEFSLKNQSLQDDCDEKSQQLIMLRVDLEEIQSASESLQKERYVLKEQIQLLTYKNTSLEEEVAKHISQIEALSDELRNTTNQMSEAQTEKADAVNKLEIVKSVMKELEAKLELECKLKEELSSDLKSKDILLTQSQAGGVSREELLSSYSEKLSLLKQEKDNLVEELKTALAEKQQICMNLEQLTAEKSEKEKEFLAAEAELTYRIKSLQEEVDKACSTKQNLEKEIASHVLTINGLNHKLESMEKEIQSVTEMNNSILKKCDKTEEMLHELHLSSQQQKELLEKSREEKNALLAQIEELQGSVDVKEELLSDTQKCIEKLRAERDSLRDLLAVKDQIIITHKNTESSLERQSNDELEVAMKLLEGEVHSSQTTSEKMAQELRTVQENFEEEKMKLQKALEEAQSTAKSYQKEAVELKQQLTGPRAGGKLAEMQLEEKMWKLERVKNQREFQFDSMMTQKIDVEDHLNQLREILRDVTRICDTLFATLPINCDAVHEVTVMKKEVESKLRAVDKKYADSLCGIISLAHEMFVLRKKQTEEASSESVASGSELSLSSDKENIEIRVSKACEVMTSLTSDVRSAINSCKFLIERCESYLKAQTRESLKIKTSVKEEIKEEVEDVPCENSSLIGQSGESKLFQSSGNMEEKSVANFTDDFKNCTHDKSDWFGGSTSLEEGYHAMKKSHANLERQVADLSSQLKELQSSVPEQIHNDMGSKMAKLQDRINVLMLRPTQEQLDEKLKELHTHYSNKLENMKTKMKQIVKDEVEKVEEEKMRSEKEMMRTEKEIIAKYSKRITEFEEHVQQLSAQLWKLGEKLLQEQQDHKTAKENLSALKERQRQYLMSKQRTQSLDRLDRLVQGAKKPEPVALSKRRCNSQIAQSSLVSAKVHPTNDDTFEIVDEGSSRRSTMMAPASMGLAFPEEDEDGEVFNNDYLAELKEGKCRAPSDGRLSELQYRNSLCPPHLKSSYPLETQFHDPQSLKDEDIKGADRRLSRQGKDRGTTSYKKPGPPTPSKKAGRLSLQGKEDVTPRVATLRDHNESVTSQGTGILRAGKTTPSRLRALFTSSKVANAATLPVSKRDENSTPATPTSKRLSIFKRRFGSNKENQSAATGYSSLH